MPADEGRAPLSPNWWDEEKKETDDYDPPPLSPLWWDRHGNHPGPELSPLHPLGLNDEKPAKSNQQPTAPIEAPPVVDEEFQQRVNAAYETLPPTIRALPDFPPIEILDEPPNPVSGREISAASSVFLVRKRYSGLAQLLQLSFTSIAVRCFVMRVIK